MEMIVKFVLRDGSLVKALSTRELDDIAVADRVISLEVGDTVYLDGSSGPGEFEVVGIQQSEVFPLQSPGGQPFPRMIIEIAAKSTTPGK
jgi:hypothetical protein